MRNILAALLTLLSLPALAQIGPGSLSGGAALPAVGQYVWERLRIDGGGYIVGNDISDDGSMIATTDVGSGHCRTVGDPAWRPAITRTSMGVDVVGGAWGPWAVAVAPSNSQVNYMIWSNSAGGSGNGGTLGRLYRSTDGCRNWTYLSSVPDFPPYTSGANVRPGATRHIAVDPRNPDVVYVCHPSQGVYRATDGVNFTQVPLGTIPATNLYIPIYSANLACNGVAIDGTSASTTCWDGSSPCSSVVHLPVYGWGVYGSDDGGATIVRRSGANPSITYTNVTTTGANGVIVVWYATQSYNASPLGVSDTSGLTWTQRPTSGCTIGAGNAQWYIRQWWAYAPNVTTTVTLTMANVIDGVSPSTAAIPFDGVDVSGLTPFDIASTACSATVPSATPVSNDALVYTAQIITGGTLSATAGWTCITCTAFNPGYTEWKQISGAASLQTPTPTGSTGTRGGFTDAMKTTGPGSVTVGTQVTGVAFTPSRPQYVYRGQVSKCDGKYYVVEATGQAYRYDPASPGSGFVQITGGPTGNLFGGIYPHPTDCGYILAWGGPPASMRFVGANTGIGQFTNTNFGIAGSWSSGRAFTCVSGPCTGGITVDAANIPWYYNANAGIAYPNYINSIDAGDAIWSPVESSPGAGDQEMKWATGFCTYSAVIPKSNNGYTLTPECEGIEITVPFVVTAISGGAYQNVFFATHDVCMFPNLSPSAPPSWGLPVRNCLAGLAGCWNTQYNKHNPDIITTVCNEAIGAENSAYADLSEPGNEGGRLQTDWRLLGGQQNSQLGLFLNGATANGNPLGTYANGGFNGNFVANACDPDNAVFFTGGGNQESSTSWPGGRAFVTNNLRVRGALVFGASSAPDAGGSIITHNGSPGNAPGGGAIAVGQGLTWGGTAGATTMRSNPVVTAIIDSTHFRVDDVNLTLSSQTMLTGPAWVYLAQTEFSGAPTTSNFGWVNGYGSLIQNITNDKVCNGPGEAQFYAYNLVAQKLYSSPTGGPGTWTVLYNGNPVTFTENRTKLYSVPQEAGMLYMTSGPYISGGSATTNYKMVKITNAHTGTPTITACPNTYMMYNVGMGAPKPGKGNDRPTLYGFGYVGGTASTNYGLWRSDDDCATWTNIAPGLATGSQLGGPQPANDWWPASFTGVEGDYREYGKVYMNQYNALGYVQGRIN